MIETKTLVGVEVKSADQGLALIKFAAYNEIDHHDDVTVKGAFKEGKKVLVSSYNHASWGGSLPVGKGVIRNSGDGKAAVAELQFFMNTQAGRETFETIKAAGELQQWSYGFNVEEAEEGEFEGKSVRYLKSVDVHEISPVLLGAGKSTATLAVKTLEGMNMTDEQIEAFEEWLEIQKAKPKPKPKPKDEDEKKPSDDKKPYGDDKKPKDEDEKKPSDEDKKPKKDEDEDDEDKPRRRKKPGDSGKMRMSDHCLEVLTSVKELADRAEEIVALRKAEGKKGLSAETQVLLDLVGDQLKRLEDFADDEPVSVDEQLIMRSFKNLSEE